MLQGMLFLWDLIVEEHLILRGKDIMQQIRLIPDEVLTLIPGTSSHCARMEGPQRITAE
jgi:hypothetical protein